MTEVKKCTKCGEVNAESEFKKQGKYLSSRCSLCIRIYWNEWSRSNRDKTRRACKEWAGANKELKSKFNAANYKSNRKKIKERNRAAVKELSGGYVAASLRIPLADCPPELIAMKREQIQIRRLTKQLNKALKDAQK